TDITFQEDDKADVSNPQFMRAKPVKDRLRINITGNNRQDEIIIRFSEDATDYADRSFDAYKMRNDYINLSSFSADSIKMAINVLGSLDCDRQIGLVLEGVSKGNYTFS